MFFDPATVTVASHQIINGLPVGGDVRRQVVSPSDPSISREVFWASEDDVDHAVTSASAAWLSSGWGVMPARARAKILYRWADLIDSHAEELARLESLVSARLYSEVMARDVSVVSGLVRYFAEYSDKVDGSVTPTPRESLSFTLHEPYGVVAAISPWNFPIMLAAWKFAPALAAGNAVVLKPSELTPFAATRLAELALQAGVPAGVFNVIHGDGAAGAALVKHPGIDYVTFTGSSATGARIMADAALTGLKPVSLELGGKGPQLVFDDTADIDRLAAMVARGVTYNAGQVCLAGSRLVVQRGIADRLIGLVTSHMSALRPGMTWAEDTTLPPIINEKQIDRIDGIVQASIAEGCEAIFGGGRMTHQPGVFYTPTVLRGVTQAHTVFREEVFGPVLAVQEFDDFEEGIALANHPEYGLSASVHTIDISKAIKAAQQLESGTIWVNDWGRRTDFTAPFGGYKRSGFGKDMGRPGFEKYLKSKAVWIELG